MCVCLCVCGRQEEGWRRHHGGNALSHGPLTSCHPQHTAEWGLSLCRPRRDLTGQDRAGRESRKDDAGWGWEKRAGEKMKYKSGSEKAGEQGLGRTCVEDTNASYTNFNLSTPPSSSSYPPLPPQSPGLEIPGGQRRSI